MPANSARAPLRWSEARTHWLHPRAASRLFLSPSCSLQPAPKGGAPASAPTNRRRRRRRAEAEARAPGLGDDVQNASPEFIRRRQFGNAGHYPTRLPTKTDRSQTEQIAASFFARSGRGHEASCAAQPAHPLARSPPHDVGYTQSAAIPNRWSQSSCGKNRAECYKRVNAQLRRNFLNTLHAPASSAP